MRLVTDNFDVRSGLSSKSAAVSRRLFAGGHGAVFPSAPVPGVISPRGTAESIAHPEFLDEIRSP